MIYGVTEWCDNDSEHFYFDTDKVNRAERFEVAYLAVLERAAQSPGKTVDLTQDTSIADRFDEYQNGMPKWKRLLAEPPCKVDTEVTLVLSG